MTNHPMRRLAAAALTLIAAAGCAVNPVNIRPPDISSTGKYTVTIEFTSALNLPAGAKVAYEGDSVGSVDSVSLDRGAVAVRASVDSAAKIPANATAAIVQDTVLGDSYIRLTRPAGGQDTASLRDGDRIPVSRTRPPASIEDMMTTLSAFLGTGSLQQLQGALRRISVALPPSDGETRRVASVLARDIRNLAAHHAAAEEAVDNLGHIASTLHDRTDYLQDLVTDDSQTYWDNLMSTASYIGVLLPSVGSIFTQGYWLIPVMDSAATAMEQVGITGGPNPVGFGWQLDQFASTAMLPFLSTPRIDITNVTGPGGVDHTADAQQVLRNLGATR